MFGALAALLALREQGVPHARCVDADRGLRGIGSYDLPYYVDHLAARLGNPSLVVCLDSGCGNYDQLWLTTSLRGMASGTLTFGCSTRACIRATPRGSCRRAFASCAQLLSRLEDEATGEVRPAELYAQVPPERVAQARRAAAALGDTVYTKFPFRARHDADGGRHDRAGAEPHLAAAIGGHRHRRAAEARATPATCCCPRPSRQAQPAPAADTGRRNGAGDVLRKLLEKDPPYGARVEFDLGPSAAGWNAPALAPWLEQSLARASQAAFGAPPAYMGEGGSIPFMAMLGEKFPQAQFVVTGVLGPHSNAHGPNEFLHIPTGQARLHRDRPGAGRSSRTTSRQARIPVKPGPANSRSS